MVLDINFLWVIHATLMIHSPNNLDLPLVFFPFFYFLNNKENEAENVYTSVQLFQPPLGGPLIKCGMLQQSAWSIRAAGLCRPHFCPSKSLEVATNGH